MQNLKPITMYQCQHCKKLFKTSNKHDCRRDPDKTNCYTCKHWGHQFHYDKSYRDEGEMTCEQIDACEKYETSSVEEAFLIMCERNWKLNCSEYEMGGGTTGVRKI